MGYPVSLFSTPDLTVAGGFMTPDSKSPPVEALILDCNQLVGEVRLRRTR